jgi:hypothetical protein
VVLTSGMWCVLDKLNQCVGVVMGVMGGLLEAAVTHSSSAAMRFPRSCLGSLCSKVL